MLLKEVTPATLNPVPLRELGTHLRIAQGFSDDGTEDAMLELYLRNATAVIENRLSMALIERAYTLQVACWDRKGHLHLPIGPVATIDELLIIDGGISTGLGTDLLFLEPGTQRQRLTGSGGGSLPSLGAGTVAELQFTAGFGPSWNQVPDDLRHAVLLLAAHFYENRDGELEADAGLPHGLMTLLQRHQTVRL